jgi:hypothetical protein
LALGILLQRFANIRLVLHLQHPFVQAQIKNGVEKRLYAVLLFEN